MDHRQRKAQVTALFEASDSGPAFKAALEDAGYVPQAAKSVSRFVRAAALALVPSLVSRFMAVARRTKKSNGGADSASHTEITSRFLSTSGSASEGAANGADFGSMFLALPLAPRPKPPRTVRRRLRSRFRARHFLKPPWMR